MHFSIHQASHIGDRRYNQDRVAYAYSSEAVLLVLADGMGGHLHGELAASLAIETFMESFGLEARPRIANPDEFIAETMRQAHDNIMRLPHDMDRGSFPGTTCVAALVQDDTMHYGHAGDSRLYLLRGGAIIARTRDHSIVQHWFDRGIISAEQARIHPQRNQITNCLGSIGHAFRIERASPVAMQSGDVVLLSSDGLWGPFDDDEMEQSFSAHFVAEALEGLIKAALKRSTGHSDNVTGIVMRWGRGEPAHETDQPVYHVLDIG